MKIGTVYLEYDKQGNVVDVSFISAIQFTLTDEWRKKLSGAPTNDEELRQKTDLVFSSWFNKVNEIELADRSEFKINSKVIECNEDILGLISRCKVEYFLSPISG
jgi:hypothetical protein